MFKPLRHAGAAALCVAVMAHQLRGGAAADLKSGLKIAFVPKQINNPYEVIADNGGMAAIKEFGGVGKVVGPSDAGASSQVQYINTLITQRQDAIVIAANDANAVVPYLKKAMSQGIKVVTFDSDTAPDGRQLFVNQANAEGIGRGQVQLVAKLMGGEGEFAMLSATPNATNQNTWIKWMQEELKKPEYSKIKLVKIAYGNDDDQKSFVETQGLLQAYPNLKAIVAPTTVGIAAAARYISTSLEQGQGGGDGSGHAEPDARVRQEWHREGIPVVGSESARVSGGLCGGGAVVGDDHGQGRRVVRRRQARQAHYRAARGNHSRTADHV